MTTKTYANDELTVVWKPDLCIHSEKCFHGLPAVFDPNRRPWIDARAASSDEIRRQVATCPSGALSIQSSEPAVAAPAEAPAVEIELARNGPLIVRGGHALRSADGTSDTKSGAVAYCRCGASSRKPYCDGSHAKVGFKG